MIFSGVTDLARQASFPVEEPRSPVEASRSGLESHCSSSLRSLHSADEPLSESSLDAAFERGRFKAESTRSIGSLDVQAGN